MAHFLGAVTSMRKSCKEFFLWQEFPFPDHPSGCSFSPKEYGYLRQAQANALWKQRLGGSFCSLATLALWVLPRPDVIRSGM
jgi:hypothetical protein